jgi:adenosine deaminase/adenosine deaminase CECR1
MKRILLLIFILPLFSSSYGQIQIDTLASIDAYLNYFRSNEAVLTEFFKQMPKGGDLHHHYSGSVPTEVYVDYALEHFWVNTSTLEVSKTAPNNRKRAGDWMNYALLRQRGTLDQVRNDLVREWSVREFGGPDYSDQFFDAFGKFSLPKNSTYDQGLLTLKQIALEENMQYLETMFTSVDCEAGVSKESEWNARLRAYGGEKREADFRQTLADFFEAFAPVAEPCADSHNAMIRDYHERLSLDDDRFTIRYQNYAVRVIPPVNVFKDLILCFLSADKSELVVGVNIVAPEHEYLSIRDYWLHMQMFAFLSEKFPDVKIAMHAGELTPDLANPVDLNFHITDAIFVAGADRIGHGVDISYESESDKVLDEMRDQRKAVEINLSSNEFILGVEGDEHPISVYYYHDVPMVISTDDAGILRTTLTDQYRILCERYPFFSYQDIKQLPFNSIELSFIEEEEVKQEVWERLEQAFEVFEKKVIEELEELPRLRHLIKLK